MDKRLTTKLTTYIREFKDSLKNELITNSVITDSEQLNLFLNYIYEYPQIEITKTDFLKRKRIKNTIPENNRCNAKKAGGCQCTRRRKDNSLYCGTHSKGAPHGEITEDSQIDNNITIEIQAVQVNGIIYYIDNIKNVYKVEDVINNVENPSVIGDYKKTNDEVIINLLS